MNIKHSHLHNKKHFLMSYIQLYQQISQLPEQMKGEVAQFIQFLLYKQKETKPIKKRQFGFAKGKIKIMDDFDAPLSEFNDYMP